MAFVMVARTFLHLNDNPHTALIIFEWFLFSVTLMCSIGVGLAHRYYNLGGMDSNAGMLTACIMLFVSIAIRWSGVHWIPRVLIMGLIGCFFTFSNAFSTLPHEKECMCGALLLGDLIGLSIEHRWRVSHMHELQGREKLAQERAQAADAQLQRCVRVSRDLMVQLEVRQDGVMCVTHASQSFVSLGYTPDWVLGDVARLSALFRSVPEIDDGATMPMATTAMPDAFAACFAMQPSAAALVWEQPMISESGKDVWSEPQCSHALPCALTPPPCG